MRLTCSLASLTCSIMLCALNAKPTKYPIVNTQFYFRSDICVVLQAAYKEQPEEISFRLINIFFPCKSLFSESDF